MTLHAALITALNVVLIAAAMVLVARARGRYQIKAPATTGNVAFERVFRAHQNTLEQTVMFLPVLWLATFYGNEQGAAWLGYAWLLGRAWYLLAYANPTGRRDGGFLAGILAWFGLLVLSFWGLISRLLA